jgi:hypothetical protein
MKCLSLVTAVAVGASLAACGSNGAVVEDSSAPSAPPIAQELAKAAKAEHATVVPDLRSPSRVLGYVEGDVITYRDVLQLIGPELAQIDEPAEKTAREDHALLDIVRKRLLYRAATDAGVASTRDEIDERRASFVKDLAKNGGTLEAFLHEHEMSRHEFDDMIKKDLIVSKYERAAIGHNNDQNVHVRPVADTYVAPEEIQRYYDRHPEKFHETSTAKCRMLAVKTDLDAPDREKAVAAAHAKADEILARLKAGEDWVPVFRRATDGGADPDPLDGLVEIHKGEKAEWIEQFAFGSAKGTLTDVRQVGTTFWILRAEGSRPEGTIPFEKAAPGIRSDLSQFKAEMAWLEVEMTVLDGSSVQPDSLRTRMRETLRLQRLKILADAGM